MEIKGTGSRVCTGKDEAGGGLLEGIVCILCPWEEVVPAVMVVMTVGPEISPNLPLSLAISLGVIP